MAPINTNIHKLGETSTAKEGLISMIQQHTNINEQNNLRLKSAPQANFSILVSLFIILTIISIGIMIYEFYYPHKTQTRPLVNSSYNYVLLEDEKLHETFDESDDKEQGIQDI